MTISSTNTKDSYSGDGTTVAFSYTFKILDDDDIQVILRTNATGAETVQTKTTDYTVSGVGNAGGGTITFGSAPAATETVVLLRNTPLTQATDYTPNDPFPAAAHEDALDKLTFLAQEIQEELDRSIKVSKTNTITSPEFTVGATDRANRIFAFDSNGDLSVTQEIGTYQGTDTTTTTSAYSERDIVKSTTAGQLNNVYICVADSVAGDLLTDTDHFELLVDAVSAATSATNAATSATAAAASETAAAASESAAATSETNAATSESNASTSETNAASSASSASTSATNAATSETNAGTSATAAASSATAAAASATAAAASESAAATSETNAATSASNASTSETNAATSASAASTSATNAATSATNAASSATSAASAQTAAEAARDAIRQFYLGAQASNPTVDGNGDPVTAGDWYFNTGDNTTRIYDGSAWNTISPDLVGDTTPQLGGNLDTNGNDINFGDNDKAIFGAGSDLQVFHDATDSHVVTTNGDLNLQVAGAGTINLGDQFGNTLLKVVDNADVKLYHGTTPSEKLATTSSGIDITGTAVTDGLTVAGNVSVDGGTIKLDGNYPTGTENVALGDAALGGGSLSGGYSVAVGDQALGSMTTGNDNTAVGREAMFSTTSGSSNVGIGQNSLRANTTGNSNVAVGPLALGANTTASNNTALGTSALLANTTGSSNVAVGANALDAATTGVSNTVAVGYNALTANTASGSGTVPNVAVGHQSQAATTTGTANASLGAWSLDANTTGANNTGVGFNALTNNTTANDNTGLGYNALAANTTGARNVAVGVNALDANTTSSDCTAIGYNALTAKTGGFGDLAIGTRPLQSLTTGHSNVAIGTSYAGYPGGSVTTGTFNTMVGNDAGRSATTGTVNTFIGNGSGGLITTGSKNTVLGAYNGNQGGLDIRTASNHIVLSDGDGNPRQAFNGSGQTIWGNDMDGFNGFLSLKWNAPSYVGFTMQNTNTTTGGAFFRFFNSSGTNVGQITTDNSTTTYSTSSDHRLKENVVGMTGATTRLKQLNPVRFNFIADADTTVDGFLAHEVQTVVPEAITGTHNEVDDDGNPVYQGIDQSKLVPLLVATIQELEARIAALESN